MEQTFKIIFRSSENILSTEGSSGIFFFEKRGYKKNLTLLVHFLISKHLQQKIEFLWLYVPRHFYNLGYLCSREHYFKPHFNRVAKDLLIFLIKFILNIFLKNNLNMKQDEHSKRILFYNFVYLTPD